MEHIIAQDFQFIAIVIIIAVLAVITIAWLLDESPISNWFKASEGIVVSFITVPAFLLEWLFRHSQTLYGIVTYQRI